MIKALLQFFYKKDGGTAIEYALLASLFAITCIGAFRATGTEATAMYQRIADSVTQAVNQGGNAQTGGPGSAPDDPRPGQNGN